MADQSPTPPSPRPNDGGARPEASHGGVRSALLLGSNHIELGQIAIEELTPNLAIGISRGRFPKGYPHVDPNEDAVFAANNGDTTILVAADGHQGIEAGHAAVRGVSKAGLPEPSRPVTDIATSLTLAAIRAVAVEVPKHAPPRNISRTSLTIAVIRGESLAAITIGDSACFVSTRRRLTRLGDPTDFLSAHTDPNVLLPKSVALPPRCAVIVTSDGILDFASDTERLLRSVSQDSSRTAVERLIEAAFTGGAGDNLSVGVLKRT